MYEHDDRCTYDGESGRLPLGLGSRKLSVRIYTHTVLNEKQKKKKNALPSAWRFFSLHLQSDTININSTSYTPAPSASTGTGRSSTAVERYIYMRYLNILPTNFAQY